MLHGHGHRHLVLVSHLLSRLKYVASGLEDGCSIVHVGHELVLGRVNRLELALLPLGLLRGREEVVDHDFLLVNAVHWSLNLSLAFLVILGR